MYVRRSNMEDIPAMMELYAQARVFMRENGNPNQWDENYPSRELLEKDIAFGNSYIVEDDEKNLAATFAFIKGEDPTYYGMSHMEPFTDLREILLIMELPVDVLAGVRARLEI